MTGRVRDMILDPQQTGRLPEVIAEGAFYGMQTFDQALFEHVQGGRVSMEVAYKAATHPHDFKLLVAAEGRRSTSMEDVGDSIADRAGDGGNGDETAGSGTPDPRPVPQPAVAGHNVPSVAPPSLQV